jgi:hypothetical protein
VTNRIPNNPATRTIPNTAAMDAARTSALAVCSAYAFQIQANPNVLDADKLAIGVAPRNFTRTPLLVPGTAPLLNIQFATAGAHTLTFADSLTPAVKGKPAGAVGIQIFTKIDTVIAPTPASALYNTTASKNPVALAFDPADSGKIATHFGRWVGKRGDVGPWSTGVSMTIAF